MAEEAVALLQLENALLRGLLQRLAPQALGGGAAAAADAAADAVRDPLLLAEKAELCAAEANAVRRETERLKAEGELERACAQAAVADARGQAAAETARDQAALLALLGLPAERAAPSAADVEPEAATTPAAAVAAPADAAAGEDGTAAAAQLGAPRPLAAPVDPAAALPFALSSARQLARADLHGGRLAQWMEDVLARHAAAATRLQMRVQMQQVRRSLPAGCAAGGGAAVLRLRLCLCLSGSTTTHRPSHSTHMFRPLVSPAPATDPAGAGGVAAGCQGRTGRGAAQGGL